MTRLPGDRTPPGPRRRIPDPVRRTHRAPALLLPALLLALLPAALASLPPAPGDPLPGPCLALEVDAWTPELIRPADSLQFALPGRVHLAPVEDDDGIPEAAPDADTPPRGGDEGPIRVPDGVMGSVHTHRWWETAADGGLLLSFRSGGLQVEVGLGPRDPGGVREGMARGTRQVEGEVAREARVMAREVACDAPIPDEEAFRWEFAAFAPLAGADTLRLGGRIPDGLQVPEEEAPGSELDPPIIRTPGVEERVLLGPEAASGFLAGAGRIEVGLAGDGRILHLDVVFPPEGNERTDLLDRMYHRFGEPTVYYAQLFAWDGRIVRLTFGSEVTGPGWVLRMSVRGDDLPTDAPPAS